MTEPKRSKEELFLIKLYALSEANGNLETKLDRYAVGKELGYHNKSIDNIVQLLTKNNFLKKGEDNQIYLTSQGIHFVESL